jgi:ribose transport system substrate-binding protein
MIERFSTQTSNFGSSNQTPELQHSTSSILIARASRRSLLLVCVALFAFACKSGSDATGTAESAVKGGTSGSGASATKKFAFITNNSSDFWNIAEKGVIKAEKEFGVDVEMFRPLKGEVSDQQRFLEDITVMGFSGAAISPINPDAMTNVLDKVAGKVPVITHDSDAPKSKRIAYVGTNNVVAGRAAGEAALKALEASGKKGGKVAMFVGRIDMQNSIERKQGVEEILAKRGDLEILPVFLDNADRAKAKKNVEDALVRYPDLVLTIGLWSYNGPVIAGTVRESARADKPVIISFDEEEEVLKAVQEGLVYATIVQKPFEFGYQSIRLLHEATSGKEVPKVYDTGIDTIGKDNVTKFWDELKELKK